MHDARFLGVEGVEGLMEMLRMLEIICWLKGEARG